MKAAQTRALHKKHAGTTKHVSKGKHTPTAHKKAATAHKQTARRTAMTAKAAKARALSLGEGVACCSAEALAASLRLAGGAVSDDDVLELHWLAGGDADTGASILAALEAASRYGLAGVKLESFRPVPLEHAPLERAAILGLEVPGPHAVLEHDGHWWSWGKRWSPSDFPHALLEEAWAVTW